MSISKVLIYVLDVNWLIETQHFLCCDPLELNINGTNCNTFKLTNKEASTALCSVVKHAGSGRARKKCRGKHETQSSVFPHFLSALPLPKCFNQTELELSRGFFICFMIKNSIISPKQKSLNFQTKF